MRILRLLLAVPLVIGGLLVLEAGPARACSCRADVVVAEELKASDGAFVGVFTGWEPGPQGKVVGDRGAVNHFQVERVVKGDLGSSVDVLAAAGGASCGLELEVGERTGLLLGQELGGWTSSLCAQVDPQALLAAGPGVAPELSGAGAGGRDWGFIAFMGLLVLALPVAFVVGGWRRRSP